MEFRVADAMNLEFSDNSFDRVYGLAITGLLPDKLKALKEYTRVVKPGGIIGRVELFPRNDIPPDVDEALREALAKIMGSGEGIHKLTDWEKLFSETELEDIEITPYYEDVFENPAFGLDTVITYIKLVYYLLTNSWSETCSEK